MDFSFLPPWPPQANAFLLFGALVLAGLLGGELTGRTRYLPRITGFIAVGLLLGPDMLGLFGAPLLEQAQPFVDMALGLILFQLGLQLDLRVFREDRSLLAAALAECFGAFVLVFLALDALGVPRLPAALAAAVAISSSPAVVLLVVRELGASGPITRRALALVAFNNVTAFFAFTALLPFVHARHAADWTTIALQPVYRVAGALLLAWVLAALTIRLAAVAGQSENRQFALLVAVIALALGLSKALAVSMLLTLMAFGVLCRNLDRSRALMEVEFGHGGEIFFIILFVVAGARLHLDQIATAGAAALAFVVARGIGKTLGLGLAGRPSGAHLRQAGLLSLTLMPMAALAIGLVQTTRAMYPQFAEQLATIVLAAVAILETIGPIATEFALKRAGEVRADRAVRH